MFKAITTDSLRNELIVSFTELLEKYIYCLYSTNPIEMEKAYSENAIGQR